VKAKPGRGVLSFRKSKETVEGRVGVQLDSSGVSLAHAAICIVNGRQLEGQRSLVASLGVERDVTGNLSLAPGGRDGGQIYGFLGSSTILNPSDLRAWSKLASGLFLKIAMHANPYPNK
jgi:hypothetical protein